MLLYCTSASQYCLELDMPFYSFLYYFVLNHTWGTEVHRTCFDFFEAISAFPKSAIFSWVSHCLQLELLATLVVVLLSYQN